MHHSHACSTSASVPRFHIQCFSQYGIKNDSLGGHYLLPGAALHRAAKGVWDALVSLALSAGRQTAQAMYLGTCCSDPAVSPTVSFLCFISSGWGAPWGQARHWTRLKGALLDRKAQVPGRRWKGEKWHRERLNSPKVTQPLSTRHYHFKQDLPKTLEF